VVRIPPIQALAAFKVIKLVPEMTVLVVGKKVQQQIEQREIDKNGDVACEAGF
jgi:hypothetical protein